MQLQLQRQRWLRPATATAVALAVYLAVVGGFRIAGHWNTGVTETQFHERLQDIHSPGNSHPGVSR